MRAPLAGSFRPLLAGSISTHDTSSFTACYLNTSPSLIPHRTRRTADEENLIYSARMLQRQDCRTLSRPNSFVPPALQTTWKTEEHWRSLNASQVMPITGQRSGQKVLLEDMELQKQPRLQFVHNTYPHWIIGSRKKPCFVVYVLLLEEPRNALYAGVEKAKR